MFLDRKILSEKLRNIARFLGEGLVQRAQQVIEETAERLDKERFKDPALGAELNPLARASIVCLRAAATVETLGDDILDSPESRVIDEVSDSFGNDMVAHAYLLGVNLLEQASRQFKFAASIAERGK